MRTPPAAPEPVTSAAARPERGGADAGSAGAYREREWGNPSCDLLVVIYSLSPVPFGSDENEPTDAIPPNSTRKHCQSTGNRLDENPTPGRNSNSQRIPTRRRASSQAAPVATCATSHAE
ncbi:hypothetical protein GCM10027271_08060 [Saccharopolyspora gloriosae]